METVLSHVREFSTWSKPVLSLRLLVSGVLLLLLRLCRLSMSPLRRGRCLRRYSCSEQVWLLTTPHGSCLIGMVAFTGKSLYKSKPFLCFSRLAPNKALEASTMCLAERKSFPSVLNFLSLIQLRFVVQYETTSARFTANAGFQISNTCIFVFPISGLKLKF